MDERELPGVAKQTMGSLTAQGVPAPTYDELLAGADPGHRNRRGPLFAAAAVVVILSVGGVLAAIRWDGSSGGGSSATCGEIVAIDGRVYDRDHYNDDAVAPGNLGDVIGVVEQSWACDDDGQDTRRFPDNAVVASSLASGTELRSLGADSGATAVAAVVDGRVLVYTDLRGDRLSFTSAVSEIGINSASDGTTRLATIDETSTIVALMKTARSAPVLDRQGDETDLDDRLYFVELVRADGLRSVIPYWIDEGILGDRGVSDLWEVAVRDALVKSPDQPLLAGITLVGDDSTASFHPNGGCRRDRPDLEVHPNQVLVFMLEPDLQLSFLFVTAQPLEPDSGDSSDAFGPEVGDTFRVPDREATLIVEATLTQTDGTVVDACTALRSVEPE